MTTLRKQKYIFMSLSVILISSDKNSKIARKKAEMCNYNKANLNAIERCDRY